MLKKIGADTTIDPTNESLSQVINDETNGHGVDISIECVGRPKLARDAIKYLNKGGN